MHFLLQCHHPSAPCLAGFPQDCWSFTTTASQVLHSFHSYDVNFKSPYDLSTIPTPLKVWSKVIVLRASGERIPQFDKICSYALILPEVPRTDIFCLTKKLYAFQNIFRSQTSKKIHLILRESFPQSFDWWDFSCTFALSSEAEHNAKLTISILNFCLSHSCWGYSRKATSLIKLLTGIRFN